MPSAAYNDIDPSSFALWHVPLVSKSATRLVGLLSKRCELTICCESNSLKAAVGLRSNLLLSYTTRLSASLPDPLSTSLKRACQVRREIHKRRATRSRVSRTNRGQVSQRWAQKVQCNL